MFIFLISILFWQLLVSSFHVVIFIVIVSCIMVIFLNYMMNFTIAVNISSNFFDFVDSVVIIPITFIVVSYVLPGFEPFTHFFCHDFSGTVICVNGQQWFWQYNTDNYSWEELPLVSSYSDGLYTIQSSIQCFLYVHQPVLIIGESSDVIHSWGVPDVGIKVDVIPGHVTLESFFL